jgi:hypothetical protein
VVLWILLDLQAVIHLFLIVRVLEEPEVIVGLLVVMAVQVVPVAQMMVEMAEMVRKVLVDLVSAYQDHQEVAEVVLVWVAVESVGIIIVIMEWHLHSRSGQLSRG